MRAAIFICRAVCEQIDASLRKAAANGGIKYWEVYPDIRFLLPLEGAFCQLREAIILCETSDI